MISNLKSWWDTEVRRIKVPQYIPKLRGSYRYKAIVCAYKLHKNEEDIVLHSEVFALRKDAEAWKKLTEAATSLHTVRITPVALTDKDGWIPS